MRENTTNVVVVQIGHMLSVRAISKVEVLCFTVELQFNPQKFKSM